jgi:RNase P subunit RPR2
MKRTPIDSTIQKFYSLKHQKYKQHQNKSEKLKTKSSIYMSGKGLLTYNIKRAITNQCERLAPYYKNQQKAKSDDS